MRGPTCPSLASRLDLDAAGAALPLPDVRGRRPRAPVPQAEALLRLLEAAPHGDDAAALFAVTTPSALTVLTAPAALVLAFRTLCCHDCTRCADGTCCPREVA